MTFFEHLWSWLLDLDRIPGDAKSMHLGWQSPLPGWILFVIIAAVGLYALWSYRGLIGRRSSRGALSFTRFVLLLLLIALLCGPSLVVPRELVERDWVIMLVDRSQSMQIRDVSDAGHTGNRVSREDQIQSIIDQHRDIYEAIAKDHQVLWMGFDEGAFDLPVNSRNEPVLDTPEGKRTAIASALEQAMRRVSPRPITGIVIFSDGQSPQVLSRDLTNQLVSNLIPVETVPLGSDQPVGDLAIDRVQAPGKAFIHDQVPVEVTVDRLGASPSGEGADALRAGADEATVTLRDPSSGETLDTQKITFTDDEGKPVDRKRVTLLAAPKLAGQSHWQVSVSQNNGQIDLLPENNTHAVDVEMVDRPLRVLYVDGYPRWEYRYLKTLLVREKSIESSIMLLSADRDFAQEGSMPIARLPNSPEEWDPFDVIIIGDVHADYFSPAQQEMIRDQVARKGAGLLFIAGSRADPSTYGSSQLAGLLPIRGSAGLTAIGRPITMMPTQTARRLSVLQINRGQDDAWKWLSDPAFGWSQLYWAFKIEPDLLKPAVEVLATTTTRDTNPSTGTDEALPLVMSMRYGAGQSMFVATDEMWRWRYGQGELFPEQFWIQLIRALARDRIALSGQAAVLTVNPHRAEVGQPVVIDLRIMDEQLAARKVAEIPVELVDSTTHAVTSLSLKEAPGAPGRYSVSYIPDRTAEVDVRVTDPAMLALGLTEHMTVFRPDEELLKPETNHALLAEISKETGGTVVEPADISTLPALFRNRWIRTPIDIVEPIWDTPLAFGLVILLITAEWIGRKFLRLT